MSIVCACAVSHAPGIRAWTESAPKEQVDVLFGAYDEARRELEAAAPETIVLLTSEHWANFFLDHIGAYCIGRGETFEGPIEPWLRVEKAQVSGDPQLAERILDHCYANGFEPSYAHEMKLDHGSMVPLSFLLPKMDRRVVPIMFNTLAKPRPSAARCLALGHTLRPVLEAAEQRIAVVATGGLSHDPGEINHGVIDSEFDKRFLDDMAGAKLERLAGYSDSDLLDAGAGTLELLAWICLAGVMGGRRARVIAYQAVKPWATGMGVLAYDRAA